MRHYLYSPTGNTLGIQSYIGYFEVGADGFCKRYVEINENEVALRYTVEYEADEHGQLPEVDWSSNGPEMSKKDYGVVAQISASLFDSIWTNIRCINDTEAGFAG